LLLFHHNGTRLEHVSASAGPIFSQSLPARGLTVGDYNNDGRIDVFIGNNGEAPLLLKNNAGDGNHWLGVRLQGTACNRDAVGARITWSAGGKLRRRLKTGGGSYLSSYDPREVLGIGTAGTIDSLEITWPQPSGRTERFTDLPIDRYVTIVEGKGAVDA
jgi:enediyne biosynthesis protein E4